MVATTRVSRPIQTGARGLAVILVVALTGGLAGGQSRHGLDGSASQGFLENRGQWDPAASFRATFGPMAVWLEKDGWTVAIEERSGMDSGPRRSNAGDPVRAGTLRGVAVRMRFEGSMGARPSGEGRLDARHNWFRGNDPAKWITDVHGFRSVRMPDLCRGVTAVAREESGHFEYDLLLDPGASLAGVVIACTGQDALLVDEHGNLVMHTRLGDLRQPAPVAWEESPSGERSSVACAWRVLEGGRFGFEVTARDPGRRLVIDPGLIWSKLFGGSADDDPGYDAIAVSAGGNINVAGVAVSTDFPTTVGAYQTTLMGNGTYDAWVARFAPSGVLLWSTYLGGLGFEWARGLAIGPNDTVTVVGSTSSANFPFVAGFDSSFNGLGGLSVGDGFLATFNPAIAGIAQLTWCTLLGGFNDDRLNSVAVDASGIVTAAGWTYSFNIPGITPPNAFRSAPQGSQDAIVCRFNPALVGNAQLVWFTFLGGSTEDSAGPMAVEPNGRVVIHGETSSSNFPTSNAFQSTLGGGSRDTFLTVLDPSLPPASQLVYSTYLGGSGNETDGGFAVDAAGRITVGGWTGSSNFPTTPAAYDTTWNGGWDAFITRLDPALAPASQLVFSTFVGGSMDEGINDLVLDPSGTVYAVGSVSSPNFPTTAGSFQPMFQGGAPVSPTNNYGPYDGFALVLDPTGSLLRYATYVGGTLNYDFAYNLRRDSCGDVMISGLTRSSDFPHTSGAYQTADDVFLLKMELLPAGVSRYGGPTPGCSGPLEIGVTSIPLSGNAAFGVTCAGAPPLGSGILAFSSAPLPSPLFASGLAVWIDPNAPALLILPATGSALGYSLVPVPLPVGPGIVGLTAFAQFGWPDPCAPGGLSGSCALVVTIL